MKLRRPPYPTLAFALPALALPLLLVLASALALRAPEPGQLAQAMGTPVPPPPPPPEKRIYVPLVTPVTLTLPGSTRVLKAELGLALRADLAARLVAQFKDKPEQLQSGLADALLRIAETLGPDADPSALRAAAPAALRDALNAKLAEMGEEPAVLEVLVTGWALSQ